MLQAMNTGHDGSLCTVHANSCRDALARIETMVLMAGFDLPVRAIRQQVASALDLIVHLERLEDGSRRVTAITEVQRMESDVITLQEIFDFKVDRSRRIEPCLGVCARQGFGRPSCTSSRSEVSRSWSVSSVSRRPSRATSCEAHRHLDRRPAGRSGGARPCLDGGRSGISRHSHGGRKPPLPGEGVRAFLPEATRLDPSTVQVLENGKVVSDLTVVPASAAGADEFGVVLVIDTSNSMRGAAIEGAMEAARSFAAHRNLSSSSRSSRSVTVRACCCRLLPTPKGSQTLGATPELRRNTHLYDGVVKAVELLDNAQMTAGSIIVLTDGADTGSTASLEEAAAAAEKAHARVFTVGLRSHAFRGSTLKTMARRVGAFTRRQRPPRASWRFTTSWAPSSPPSI